VANVVIVDEFHVVQLEGRRGDDAINAVKAIINNTGVVTVLAGIDLDVQLGSRAAEQLIARGEVHRYNPFDYAASGVPTLVGRARRCLRAADAPARRASRPGPVCGLAARGDGWPNWAAETDPELRADDDARIQDR